jgi:hypothetical protein
MTAADRLAQIDAELASLGKSEDEIREVRGRAGAQAGASLQAVDQELEALAGDLAGAKELLAHASPSVAAVPAVAAADEDLFKEAPWGEAGAEAAEAAEAASGRASLLGDDLFGDTEVPAEGRDEPLTADPTLSQPPPPPAAERADLEAQGGDGLADLLEGEEPAPPPQPAAPSDFDISDSTDMMTVGEMDAIRGETPDAGDEVETLDEDELEILIDDEDL